MEVHEAEKRLKGLQEDAGSLEARFTEMHRERTKLEAERAKVQTQLQVLEQAEKSLSGLNQGAKTVLEAARKGKLARAGIRPISHLLEVPADYETAIASALGDFLDGVVLESDASLEEVLDLLETGDQGRAAILPSAHGAANKGGKAINQAGVIGNASDLIQSNSPLAKWMEVLLGSVYVVEDRAAAKKIVPLLNDGGRAVTLKGEVFWANGVVVAGKDNRSAVISRPRQKREYQDQVNTIERDLDQLLAQEEDLTEEISKMQAQAKQQQAKLQESRNALNEIARAFQKADLAPGAGTTAQYLAEEQAVRNRNRD